MNNVTNQVESTNKSTFFHGEWNALISEAEKRLAECTDPQRRKDINRAINVFREYRDKGEMFPPSLTRKELGLSMKSEFMRKRLAETA